MILYSKETVGCYHLSDYVQIVESLDGYILRQTLFHQIIHLSISKRAADLFFSALLHGCRKDRILCLLDEFIGSKSEDVLKQLLLGGFIE